MSFQNPKFTEPIEEVNEKRRYLLRGFIWSFTPTIGWCVHSLLEQNPREKILQKLSNMEILMNEKSKPMPRNIELEWPNERWNYILRIPDLDLITEDTLEINHHWYIVTDRVKIRLKPLEFRAKVAASIYNLREWDIYMLKNWGQQIVIEKQ